VSTVTVISTRLVAGDDRETIAIDCCVPVSVVDAIAERDIAVKERDEARAALLSDTAVVVRAAEQSTAERIAEWMETDGVRITSSSAHFLADAIRDGRWRKP
jgi:hypothetical protein